MIRYIFNNENEIILNDNDTATYIGKIGNTTRGIFYKLARQGKISFSNKALQSLIEEIAIQYFSKKMGIVIITEK